MFLVPRPEQFDPPINLAAGATCHIIRSTARSRTGFLPAAKLACGLLRDAWVPTKPAALPVSARSNGPSAIVGEAKRYRQRWIPCADD